MVPTKSPKRARKLIVPIQVRPRHEKLNAALVDSGGGLMKSLKDFNRAREKAVSREIIKDTTEENS